MIASALVAEARGQFVQAADFRENLASYYQSLGRKDYYNEVFLGFLYLLADRFNRGRALLEQATRELEAQGIGTDNLLAFSYFALACLAVAEGKFGEAKRFLQKSTTDPEATSLTGIVYMRESDPDSARRFLLEGLQRSLDGRKFHSLAGAILGIALEFAHHGMLKQARELYELIWRFPRFNKSALDDAMAGQKLRELTAGLLPDEVAAIKERAAEKDVWQEAAVLLEELKAAGWGDNDQ